MRANSTLAASHGNRFWQEVAVPAVSQIPQGSNLWPYIFWQMVPGTRRSTKSILREEYIGKQTSVWRVWSVRRFTGRPDWSVFNPDILQMREALTGVNCVPVYNSTPALIGNIYASTLYPPEIVEQEDDRDDDIAILSKGIVIRVTHK